MPSRNRKQNKQHQGAAAGSSRAPQNALPPAATPPAPQIVIDRDDGDPPSSRRLAETSPNRNGGPRTAADSGARSVGTPFALASAPSPAAGSLHPASATATLVSTPPPRDNRHLSAAMGSSPLTPLSSSPAPLSSLQSPARISGSTGKKSDSSGKSRKSGDTSSKKKRDPSKQATVEDVDDVDDSPAVIAARAAKKKKETEKERSVSNTPPGSSPPPPSRTSRTPPVVHDGGSAHVSAQGSVTSARRASDRSHAKSKKRHNSKERSHHARSNHSNVSSKYPAASILKEYAGSGMSSSDRAARRAEKRRNSNATTPRHVPLPSSRDADVSNEDMEILYINDPEARRLADEAVERERARLDNSPEAIALREQYNAERRRLEEQCGDEYAAELAARFAAEDADADLAVKAQQKEVEWRAQALREAQCELAEEEESARADAEAARALLKTAEDQCVDFNTRKQKLAAALATEEERIRVLSETPRNVRTSQAGSEGGVKPPPYDQPDPPVKNVNVVTPTLKDRVMIQRFREADLQEYGASRDKDQGIDWDTFGRPVEIGPAPAGSLVNSRGGPPTTAPVQGIPLSLDAGSSVSEPRPSNPEGATSTCRTHDVRIVDERRPPKKEGSSSSRNRPPKTPKREEGSNFYLGPGTAPPAGEPEGGSLSSSSSSSESDSGSDSAKSGTYRTETNYTRSEGTDSAFGGSHDVEKVVRKIRDAVNDVAVVTESPVSRTTHRHLAVHLGAIPAPRLNNQTRAVNQIVCTVRSARADLLILHEGAQTKLTDSVVDVTVEIRV
ncbi:hypothetical protein C8R45DRAFT_1114901 [Mycena sanguinolenta]|nr:hypothetical protein C8R45DRAFT_1114901 [Mycena sanguinolenta]